MVSAWVFAPQRVPFRPWQLPLHVHFRAKGNHVEGSRDRLLRRLWWYSLSKVSEMDGWEVVLWRWGVFLFGVSVVCCMEPLTVLLTQHLIRLPPPHAPSLSISRCWPFTHRIGKFRFVLLSFILKSLVTRKDALLCLWKMDSPLLSGT